jgi:hypothetical protein
VHPWGAACAFLLSVNWPVLFVLKIMWCLARQELKKAQKGTKTQAQTITRRYGRWQGQVGPPRPGMCGTRWGRLKESMRAGRKQRDAGG